MSDLQQAITDLITHCRNEGYNSATQPLMAIAERIAELEQQLAISEKARELATCDLLAAFKQCMGRIGEVQDLKGENAELRKDAERYRWLREMDWIDDFVMADMHITEHDGPSLDRAIDAAMEVAKDE